MFFSTFICLLVFLSSIIYIFFKILKLHYGRSGKYLRKMPGPPAKNIFLGNLWHLQVEPDQMFELMKKFGREYYPIYQLHAMHQATVQILTPEDCEIILSNSVHNEKGFIYKLLHDWLKGGLLTSNGTKWQTRRKILTPAFHFNILQQFLQIFHEEADELVKVLRNEAENSNIINVTPLLSQFTLKAIAETAMGTKLQFQTKKDLEYKQAISNITKCLLYRLFHPWFLFPWTNIFSPKYLTERRSIKILHRYTKEVIKNRSLTFNEGDITENHDVYRSKKRLAMLDLLLSAKNEKLIDDAGIQEEVDTFLFEGHDTTGSSLGYILMLLANNLDCQKLILNEMELVLGNIHKKPNYSEFQELKYLERCIKESLRLYPIVYFLGRSLGEDIVTNSGYLVPKHTTAVILIYCMHHNPEIYPDPEKFDPDRFLPENCQHRHPYAYLPFSAGARNCIGQKFAILELKAAVCTILAKFELHPIDTPDTIQLVADIVIRTKEGIKVKFVPRT